MDNLVKQMRVSFSGVGQDSQDLTSARDRRIPPQKTNSFKAASVAATAFAINYLEEAELENQKKMRERQKTTLVVKDRSKKDNDVTGPQEATRASKRSSDDPSMKKPEGVERSMTDSAAVNTQTPEKAASRVPTIKKTSTLADQISNETNSKKPESAVDTKPRPTPPPSIKPTLSTAGDEKHKGDSTRRSTKGSRVDAWEKAETEKIKKRDEKTKSTILSWENEKKAKARRQLERKQRELEQKTRRALHHFENKLARINQIAEGARAQAEENRRNDESKVKDKANKFRSSGKVTGNCCGF
ncbi:PREDICTED: remorin-like isoform X2 [Nelumbo nucifera]|uniref:Remorin-like isoform X2 n=1 Tax=Nelumbo nucifera TaxID=4432 RepID=A0A1U8Q3R3_NELNU|nr:PREDICTED: remorin-like isoform X2 [Nelumbo nucifera]